MNHEPPVAEHQPFLSVVIPAFNEERRIGASLRDAVASLEDQPWSWDILVVDDGSTDRTAAIVNAMTQVERRVRLLSIPHGGKGSAVKAGMLAASGALRYLADADFSTPMRSIGHFLAEIERGADLAIGSRQAPGALRIGEPFRRHLMGRVFNRIIQWLVLPGIQDTQCGFKCLRAAVAEDLFARVGNQGFAFDVELLAHARHLGYRTREVPVEWTYVPGGKVRMVRDTVRMFVDVLRIRRLVRQRYGCSVPHQRDIVPLQNRGTDRLPAGPMRGDCTPKTGTSHWPPAGEECALDSRPQLPPGR